ncbi:hypothetical protein VTN02DRAFT_4039 [Thermoascus thermophilus]
MSIGLEDLSTMNKNSFFQGVFPIDCSMPSDHLPPTPNQLCDEALPISSHVSPDYPQVNKFSGFSLDVISASSYPVPEPTNPKASRTGRGSRQTLHGGLSSSGQEEKTKEPGIARSKVNSQFIHSNKQLNRASPALTDDASKKRGRPRLDTTDETAAERRRTQIRLAQRAYRLRKETTISALNQRVTELEQTIKEMNKTFLAFNDQVMESGLLAAQPELAQQLQCTTERFLSLANQAVPSLDCESSTRDRKELEEGPPLVEGKKLYTNTQASQHATNAHPLGYVFTYDDTNRSETNWAPDMWSGVLVEHQIGGSAQGPDLMTLDASHVSGVFSPETRRADFQGQPNIEQLLHPRTPFTYSSQETTFARRLHLTCLERGYRLLTSPLSDPEEVFRVFRFAFCVSNRKHMIPRFQKLLKRGADEALEFWGVPFFHIGGAGMHYPRKDQ